MSERGVEIARLVDTMERARPEVDHADPDALAEDFMRLIVAVASGRAARNELNEEREIAIWKDGVTL